MSTLANRITQLSPAKLALLSQRLKENNGVEADVQSIPRRDAGAPAALSYAQQRLWFLDQLDTGSVLYNIPAATRLRGSLDISVLAATLSEIVRRHEVLRTTFDTIDGRAVQVVAPAQAIDLPFVDLSAVPEPEKEARRLAFADAVQPFDLTCGPLLRAAVIKLDEEDHVILLTMHHIVSDGWSVGVLTREVAALYGAFSNGQTSPLAELPIQYADYAAWEREWLTAEVLEAQLSYWKQQLGGSLPLLELPTDRPRPAEQTHRGAVHSLLLSPELSEQLKAMSRKEGVTLFMLLLAAFKTLLFRYTGQDDVIVGTPIAGRSRVETEKLIGFFVNTLVLRTDLSGNPGFRALLQHVREVVLEAHQHQRIPFEKLVDELHIERTLSHTPLFQIAFSLQNAEPVGLQLPGLRLSGLGGGTSTAKFDLTLDAVESAQNIRLSFEYRTDLFDEATIQRLLSHFQNLLQAIVSQPDRRVSELPLLSDEESRRLLSDFNPPAPALPAAACLHQQFEIQAARASNSVALSCEGRHLSYGEVNARANRLAHQLRSLGVRPEDRVALLLDRTPDLVIAILGILKAGAAYLPLDPAYPQERLSFMLADAGAQVVVTEQSLIEPWLSEQSQAALVCLDDEVLNAFGDENLSAAQVGVTPQHAAYVIYTSGSTGQPKGVVVTHENVWRLLEVTRADFKFAEADVWTLFHSVCFDFSVWELWGALTHGARLVVVPYWVSREPEAFYELVRAEGVTVLNQTPSAFRQLMKVDEAVGGELALRVVIFGGEALEMGTLRGWFARHGEERPRLVNMYGITETTVHVTYRELGTRDTEGGSVIGGALADLTVYVLDEQLRAVPEGVSGELYVGGGGVARGYLGRAELTAERFVPNPFTEQAGARLYRTGDLARRRADGELEYLGRLDDQVKVRGFRIELGEIASALREQAGVRECVVMALGAGGEEKRLVAYVVGDEGTNDVSVGDLRAELKQRLPDYMVPAIVLLDEMPLTANGKVDKRKLLEAEKGSRGVDEKSYVAPRTPVEELIAGIWRQVLNVERIGVHDNFFALGGDSILSIQITARANQANLNFTTKQLFLHQTIAELAAVAVEKGASTEPTEAGQSQNAEAIEGPGRANLKQDGEAYTPSDFPLASLSQRKLDRLVSRDMRVEDIYPLSPMQQGMLFQSAMSPEAGAYVTQTVCRLPGSFDSTAFSRACQKVIERHTILRTSFAWEGLEEPLQIVHERIELAWDEHDWRGLAQPEQQTRLQAFLSEDQQRGFELTKAPLMRFALFQTSDDAYQLVWTSHHLLLDGWSGPLVLKEVFDFYSAYSRGANLELKQPRPFRDYIAWLQTQDLTKAETFWRETLQGFQAPTRFITAEMSSGSNGKEAAYLETRIAVPSASASALQTLARQHQLTLNTIIQGVWALLLSHYSGENDVVFGSTVSGRPADLPGVETMVGLFINTLPVRVKLKDDDSLVTWLQRLQRDQAEMRQFDSSPLVQLQGWSDVPRGQPLFESNLVFFNLPEEATTRDPKAVEPPAPKSQGLAVSDLNVQSKTPTDIPVTLKAMPGARSLQLEMLYDNRRIDAGNVGRLLNSCQALIERILAQPQSDLHTLKEMLKEMEINQRQTDKSKRKEFDLKRLKSLKPKTVSLSRAQLIKTDFLKPGATLPLVVQPNDGDIDLIGWAKNNREFIATNLLQHGGLLFRGFDVETITSFDEFTKAIAPDQLEYMDQHTPRTRLAGKIYTSTEYPAEHYVPFHSENSKNHVWPMKIWFYCMQPAAQGGETPIADNAKVFELLSPEIRERFVEKKVMYVRNFGEGVGLPWQTVFQTAERSEVEAYFREAGLEFEWKDENRLRTSHVCQSVVQHPQTKKMLWFNQAHLFHISTLEASARESLLSIFKEHELPSNAYYGDGSPIEDSIIEEIREAFKQASVAFPWQSRDILMLDNMAVAHSRAPYSGTRKVVVAMAESFSNSQP